jgi:hypothetical protein
MPDFAQRALHWPLLAMFWLLISNLDEPVPLVHLFCVRFSFVYLNKHTFDNSLGLGSKKSRTKEPQEEKGNKIVQAYVPSRLGVAKLAERSQLCGIGTKELLRFTFSLISELILEQMSRRALTKR